MKKALFTGTFDPFTVGHRDIVRRTLLLADEVLIGVAESRLKGTAQSMQMRVEAIARLYRSEERVRVCGFSDLTIDLAKREKIDFIVRGLRSVRDYEYELAQADYNRAYGGVETVFLPTLPELAMVSSSLVKELQHFGKDVTPFLPADSSDNIQKEHTQDD